MGRTLLYFVLVLLGLTLINTAPASKYEPKTDEEKLRHKIALECIAKVGIDKKVIERAMDDVVLPKGDQKYKDFLTCSYKKQGYQSDDGHILMHNIHAFLKRFYNETQLTVLEPCENLNETSSAADNAFNALDCILPKLQSLD